MTSVPEWGAIAAQITCWALEPATRSLGLAQALEGLGARLLAAGVPVRRMRTSVTTKHPELFVRAVMWHAERGTDVRDGKRELLVTATYLGSPVARVRAGEPRIRCRLTGPDADLSFAICEELAAEGLTTPRSGSAICVVSPRWPIASRRPRS